MKISEDLRPLSELKSRTASVVGRVRRSRRPVVLTRYGKGVAVLMSVEEYEELQSAAARLRVIAALQEAEDAIARGDVHGQAEMKGLLAELASRGA
jgi:prevent-host-death family protein